MTFCYGALRLYDVSVNISDKLYTWCDEATVPGCTSRSLLHSGPILFFVTARQPESHRSPAQMPWLSFHVWKRAHVCMYMSVCACVHTHRLLAPQQDCQSVCDFTPTQNHLLLSHHSSPSFAPFSSSCLAFNNILTH